MSQPAQQRPFLQGEKVHWMEVRSSGRGLRFKHCEGVVVRSIDACDTLVRRRNGREAWVMNTDLRHSDQPSQTNEVFNAITTTKQEAP